MSAAPRRRPPSRAGRRRTRCRDARATQVGHRPGDSSPSAAPLRRPRAASDRRPRPARCRPSRKPRREPAPRAARGELQQPAEDRDRGQRDQLVPDARVQEGRDRHAPPLAVDRPGDRHVDHARPGRAAGSRTARGRRARSSRTGRAPMSPRMPGISLERKRESRGALGLRFRLPGLARLGDGAVALDLGSTLAQPIAAVRTLGDIGADLVAAVLADDVEIGHLCHGCPDSRPARAYALNRRSPRPMNECGGTPSRRLPVREPSRAQCAVLREGCARPGDRDDPRRAPRGARRRTPAAGRGRDELRARSPDRHALGDAAGRRRCERALSHR